MKKTTLLIICCAFLVVSGFAQNLQGPNNCSPVGTWYGGSDVKYVLTITPAAGERFSVKAEVVLDMATIGVLGWTSWSGEFGKVSAGSYVGQYISMYTSSSEVPPPPSAYELDAVRGWMRFIDCNNIKITYDFYGLYFDLNKIPYVDPPDLSVDPSGILETYHRMPTTCPTCGSIASVPMTQLRQKR